MKRIVAVAALTVTVAMAMAMASIPVTAMASTSSPAQGPGPVPAPVRCPPAPIKPRPGVVVTPPGMVAIPAPGKAVVVVACCGKVRVRRDASRPVPVAQFCVAQIVEFDMAAGSSVVTEVHGARLHHGERLLYKGEVYTIRSVWGDHFDVDHQGRLVVNTGPAIRKGVAIVIMQGAVVVLSPAPPPGR